MAVERVELGGTETAPELEAALASLGAGLLLRSLPGWLAGTLEPHPQGGGATLTRPLRREDGRFDPGRSAVDLEREVRAFQPWPGSWFDTSAGRITVLAARALVPGGSHESGRDAGRLGPVGDAPSLVTGQGLLQLTVVRLAGVFAEAAIAWWHAYEARRRRRLIAFIVLLCLFAALVARLTEVRA